MKINKIHFDSIDSTNNYARNTAGKLALPALITAAEQTKGRGRNGKSFYSPANTGLYMTVLFSADTLFEVYRARFALCSASFSLCRSARHCCISSLLSNIRDTFSVISSEPYSIRDRSRV